MYSLIINWGARPNVRNLLLRKHFSFGGRGIADMQSYSLKNKLKISRFEFNITPNIFNRDSDPARLVEFTTLLKDRPLVGTGNVGLQKNYPLSSIFRDHGYDDALKTYQKLVTELILIFEVDSSPYLNA